MTTNQLLGLTIPDIPSYFMNAVMNKTIELQTRDRDDWVDITREVAGVVEKSGVAEGTALIFVPHTTAAVTIQENADPPLKGDITKTFDRLFPWRDGYRHGEENAAAHMKAIVTGSSELVPIQKGRLQLGTWQGIYLCEFDGPRRRRVIVRVS